MRSVSAQPPPTQVCCSDRSVIILDWQQQAWYCNSHSYWFNWSALTFHLSILHRVCQLSNWEGNHWTGPKDWGCVGAGFLFAGESGGMCLMAYFNWSLWLILTMNVNVESIQAALFGEFQSTRIQIYICKNHSGMYISTLFCIFALSPWPAWHPNLEISWRFLRVHDIFRKTSYLLVFLPFKERPILSIANETFNL